MTEMMVVRLPSSTRIINTKNVLGWKEAYMIYILYSATQKMPVFYKKGYQQPFDSAVKVPAASCCFPNIWCQRVLNHTSGAQATADN